MILINAELSRRSPQASSKGFLPEARVERGDGRVISGDSRDIDNVGKGGENQDKTEVSRGVPQGSVLGPIRLIIYTLLQIYLRADESQIYFKSTRVLFIKGRTTTSLKRRAVRRTGYRTELQNFMSRMVMHDPPVTSW